VLKVMVRAKTLARTVLVTDATAAAAQPPGRYRLGDIAIDLSSRGRATMAGTDRLAGSALTLDVALANAARFTGRTLEEVLPLATTQPARAVGLAVAGRVLASWDPEAFILRVEQVLS
jgi:N-acetylglucosamine-6-phosphate deacetylase